VGRWGLVAGLAVLTSAIAAGPSGVGGPHPPPARPTTGSSPSAYDQPGTNREGARVLALSLLDEAWLPPDATAIPVPAHGLLSQPQSTFGSLNLIDLSVAYSATIRTFLFQEELTRHAPLGTSWSGGGTGSAPGTPDVYSLEFALRRLPSFAEAAQLVYSYYGYGPRTLIRLDAEVIWRPYRSRSTELPPRLRRALIRSVPETSPTSLRPQTISIGPGTALDSLVSAVDSEPAVAPGLNPCALIQEKVTVDLYAGSGARPVAEVTLLVGCVDITLQLKGQSIQLQASPTLGVLQRLLRSQSDS
jgi:hypothetical protein